MWLVLALSRAHNQHNAGSNQDSDDTYQQKLKPIHNLYRGPYTFKNSYEFDVAPKLVRRDFTLWQEPYAAEAASQMAMWIQVSASEFPDLRWDTLQPNVLAHYNPAIHEIVLNTLYRTAYFNEPTVLRLVMLHELLHSFQFGSGNLTRASILWERDFGTTMPAVDSYHWSTDAEGYHFRTTRPADAELMQPVLNSFTFLSMASLEASVPNLRYACDRNEDCAQSKKCIFDSSSWVGMCEHVLKQDSGSDTVLAIILVLVVTASFVTFVILSSPSNS